jgi:DtxR family Mn-dependent transcriptional regulator
MLPSSTVENYLKAIYLGVAGLSPPQRLLPMGQLATALGVAPGTATTMVKTLAESGLVEYEPYAGVALTTSGEKLAALVLRRHRLIELFLVRVMGYSWDEVHDEAEQLEHAVSDRLIDRMDEMLGRPEVDPHGDPIPTADGLVRRQEADTLLTCPLHTRVTVVRVMDQDKAFLRFIEGHHLKPGQSIEVEHRDAASDSVRVRGAGDQRVTIGTRAASKLLVHVARALLVVIAVAAVAGAQDAAGPRQREDKRQFTLFHPTPQSLLREMSADRPDRTDSPFTVDAGHVQAEMDLVNLTLDAATTEQGRVRATAGEIAPLNVKLGLRHNIDLQFVSTPYRLEQIRAPAAGSIEQRSWFPAITPRVKLNLTGNDGGAFAIAVLPFVTIATARDAPQRVLETGVGVPYAFAVPGWDLGLQSTVRLTRSGTNQRRQTEFDNSISIGRTVVGRMGVAGEVFTTVGPQAPVATTNTWVTYRVSDGMRLDGGVYIGVTDAADDWHPWFGLTWRY